MYGRRMCDVLHGRVVTRGGAGTGGGCWWWVVLVEGRAHWRLGDWECRWGRGIGKHPPSCEWGDGVRQLEPMHARTAGLALLFVPSPCPGGAGCMFPIPPANAPPSECYRVVVSG